MQNSVIFVQTEDRLCNGSTWDCHMVYPPPAPKKAGLWFIFQKRHLWYVPTEDRCMICPDKQYVIEQLYMRLSYCMAPQNIAQWSRSMVYPHRRRAYGMSPLNKVYGISPQAFGLWYITKEYRYMVYLHRIYDMEYISAVSSYRIQVYGLSPRTPAYDMSQEDIISP